MHGRLFTLLDTPFPSYFVLIVIGFVFAASMGALWARRVGQNPDVIVDLGLLALLSGFAGARVLHLFADGHLMDYVHMCTNPALVDWHITQAECLGPSYQGAWDAAAGVCHPIEKDCFAWAQFWSGGFTFFGGLIAATIASWWLFKRDRFPFWKAVDMGGMMVPIGLGFGRLGCLMAGCCFGEVSAETPWALSFPGGSPASDWQAKEGLLNHHLLPSLPVHPTQIYESMAAFAIAALGILYVHGRKRYDGQVFVFFLVSYGLARFGIEFLRSDERGGVLWFSTSQWIGLFAVGAGLVLRVFRLRHIKTLPTLPPGAALGAALCLPLLLLFVGCGPKEKEERFPPLKDRCSGDLCKGGGSGRTGGGGVVPSDPDDDSNDDEDGVDAGTLTETVLGGNVLVATSPDLTGTVDLADAELELSASSNNGGVKLTDYSGQAPFELTVTAFPALLIARQTSGDAELMTTLQWVDEGSEDLELLIVDRNVLVDVADNLSSGSATLKDGTGHVMIEFVDSTGAPVPEVSLTAIGVAGPVVTYDVGATYTDATASTGARGSVLLLNVPGAAALPGQWVTVEFETVDKTGQGQVRVAKDALTLQRIEL
jgi:phosphatidylglycerol:prolipoprotein diacylglycerol transferase